MATIDALRKQADRLIVLVEHRLAAARNSLLQRYRIVLTDSLGNITYETPESELASLPMGVSHKEYYGFDPNDDGIEP